MSGCRATALCMHSSCIPGAFSISARPHAESVGVPGPAKAAWGIGSLDEEGNVDSYEFDAIGGAVHENEKNALLNDSAKETMFDWSKQG